MSREQVPLPDAEPGYEWVLTRIETHTSIPGDATAIAYFIQRLGEF